MTCPSCGKDRVVFVTSWVVVLGKKLSWTQCSRCHVNESEAADRRAMEAIEQAERAGA